MTELALGFLPVLNYCPYLDKYERSSADAETVRGEGRGRRGEKGGFNAGIPLPGQRIKARCTDDHQLTFALSSHFPFLAASSRRHSPKWRGRARGCESARGGEKPVKCNNSKCERNSFATVGAARRAPSPRAREWLHETPVVLPLPSPLFFTSSFAPFTPFFDVTRREKPITPLRAS